MTTMLLPRVVARTARCRMLSTSAPAGPKMHKAKGNWDAFKAKRPIDEDELVVRI